MTQQEAKSKASIRIQLFDAKGANKLIDQIYNDHEAQLKLASDVYSTDKMHMYQELKAKDEITQDIKEAYELKSIAYDLLLEAIQLKDDEIERLNELVADAHRCEEAHIKEQQ